MQIGRAIHVLGLRAGGIEPHSLTCIAIFCCCVSISLDVGEGDYKRIKRELK